MSTIHTSPDIQTTRRPRLLMLTHRIPYPLDRGDRIRTWQLIQSLSPTFDIYLASFADEPVTFDTWSVLRNNVRQFVFDPITPSQRLRRAATAMLTGKSITQRTFSSRRITRTLKAWQQNYRFDAALAVCSSTAPYLLNLPIPTRVADFIDLDSAKWHQYANESAGPQSLVYKREAILLEKLERYIADKLDAVSFVTESEAQLAQQIAPKNANIIVAPNGVDTQRFTHVQHHDAKRVVFTGVMNYKPNTEAIAWFAHKCWPQILADHPDAQLDIVGRDPTPQVEQLADLTNINVTGAVPDPLPYLNRATLAIAPLQIARGIQNKVLEAMACGKPVVATPQAADGIIAEPGRDLLTASNTNFAQTVSHLLAHPHLSNTIGRFARRTVQLHHDWDTCLQPMLNALTPHPTHPAIIDSPPLTNIATTNKQRPRLAAA